MALSPIAFIAPNYRDFKNYWLKAYEPGTTTPKIMALDDQGDVTVAKLELNKDGFLKSAGGALVIPYLNGAYDLFLFPTEAEAVANDTVNAEQVADNILGMLPDDAIETLLINDLSQAYEFATVALYKAFATEFPIGKVVKLLDRNAEFLVITGTGMAVNEVSSDQVSQSLTLNETDIDLRMLGAVSGEDNTVILAFAFANYSEFIVQDTDCLLFECEAASNTKVTFINSDIGPITGLTGGTLNDPHRLIIGDAKENIKLIGINSSINSSIYYPADSTHPVNGVYERVAGIYLTNPKNCVIDGFHLLEMSFGGITMLKTDIDGMININVKNITGDKPCFAFKAIYIGGEDEENKAEDIRVSDVILRKGGRVPQELGEDAGFDFGIGSTDHISIKNCNDVRLSKLTSKFSPANGIRVEKCTNIQDTDIISHEAGQEGLQYYNTGTNTGQSSQPIVTRWGRIPNLASVRMFGGIAYIMREYVTSNTVADPSADARFEVCPYTIANTAGIPAYDTALTGGLFPFRGYGGVAPVFRCLFLTFDNPMAFPARDKTGPTFDYASDFGLSLIHNSNSFTPDPTSAVVTNGARISGNKYNINAGKYLDPVNLTLSLVSLRISGLPDTPNNTYDLNDLGLTKHVTGGISTLDPNSRLGRPDIAAVYDSNGDQFIEFWQTDASKTAGIKILRADDPAEFLQINFGNGKFIFGVNGVNVFEIDATGGHDLP